MQNSWSQALAMKAAGILIGRAMCFAPGQYMKFVCAPLFNFFDRKHGQ